MVIYLPLLVCLVGLVIFLLSKTNPDAKEIGRIMFWTGLLAFLMGSVPHLIGVVR